MTRTVARLILAMLLLPCTGAVFLLLFLVRRRPAAGPPAVGRLLLMWGLLYAFVGAYWVVLWRDMVTWNRRRVVLTAARHRAVARGRRARWRSGAWPSTAGAGPDRRHSSAAARCRSPGCCPRC